MNSNFIIVGNGNASIHETGRKIEIIEEMSRQLELSNLINVVPSQFIDRLHDKNWGNIDNGAVFGLLLIRGVATRSKIDGCQWSSLLSLGSTF